MSKSLGNVIDPMHLINGVALEGMLKELHSGNLPQAEVTRAESALKLEYPKGIQVWVRKFMYVAVVLTFVILNRHRDVMRYDFH